MTPEEYQHAMSKSLVDQDVHASPGLALGAKQALSQHQHANVDRASQKEELKMDQNYYVLSQNRRASSARFAQVAAHAEH